MASVLFKDTTYSVSGLIDDISRGEVALPDIQRPFVWPASKVRDLLDSMYKGFPVGYLLFHFGSEEEQRDAEISALVGHPQVQQFVPATVALVKQFASKRERVLDLGCAVGGASFELSRSFQDVIGLDYSQSFIDAANALKRDGHLDYVRHDSGRFSTS